MKWEYVHYLMYSDKEQEIRDFHNLGNEGWELVTINNNTAYFKRPKPFNSDEYWKEAATEYFGGKVG
ncbi:MAG: hypothetical protein ACW99F_17400 [Candidatus Hodarchaeales archaeon]|jgi:hypothetical protein